MSKIWILNPFTNKVMQVDENDPRLDMSGDVTEKRIVFFKFKKHRSLNEIRNSIRGLSDCCRSGLSRDSYAYAIWGATEEDLCERVNGGAVFAVQRCREEIVALEEQIVALEKAKLRPKGKVTK